MNQQLLCCSDICIPKNYHATYMHSENFDLRCGVCLKTEEMKIPYFEIADVFESCKQQLQNAKNQIEKNNRQMLKAIEENFKKIIEQLQYIEKSIIDNIQKFILPQSILDLCHQTNVTKGNCHEFKKIIQNFFSVKNYNNQISCKEEFKFFLDLPQKIQDSLVKLNEMLSQFIKEIQGDINNQQKFPSILQQNFSIYDPIAPPSNLTIINIMNQQNAQSQPTKCFQFQLKSKQTFNLKGLSFGKETKEQEITIIIKDEQDQEIFNGNRNMSLHSQQILFSNPIQFKENKEYFIQISKKYQIHLMIYKVKLQNEYVEVSSDSTPIDALLI